MGAGGLLALKFGRRKKRPSTTVNPAMVKVAQTASRFTGAANPEDRLETLDRLRKQGTITEAEFQTLKSKIVEDT